MATDLEAQSDALEGLLGAFMAFWSSLPKKPVLPHLADFLDRLTPEIAPYLAIVDVPGPDRATIRFFGTQITDRAAFDPTGRTVADLYTAELRAQVHGVLWEAVSRPVGYLSRRKIVGKNGFANVHPSLGLPIEIPTSGVRGIANLSHSVAAAERLVDDRAYLVQEMALERWLDIGAGVPG